MKIHTPVLLDETLLAFEPLMGKTIIDATGGEGGHSKAMVEKGAKLLILDADPSQVENLKTMFKGKPATAICANFRDIAQVGKDSGFSAVDGVLFDFGLSMGQLERSGKGFSYKQYSDNLDMRLQPGEGQSAADFLAQCSEAEAYFIFAKYGEEFYSRSIAKAIIVKRSQKAIDKVTDLIAVIDSAFPHPMDQKTKESTYSRIFQALRMHVNDEFTVIQLGIQGAVKLLKTNGRLVVLTFHSGEDRLVKQFAKTMPLSVVETVSKKKYLRRPFERSAIIRVYRKQ